MRYLKNVVLLPLTLSSCLATATLANAAELDLKFAGSLEFSDTGTLFVGDNYNGAIYAFDMTAADVPESIMPVNGHRRKNSGHIGSIPKCRSHQ